MPYNIYCERCGHRFEAEKWYPGLPCEKCKAEKTVPKGKVGEEPGARKPAFGGRRRSSAGFGWKHNPVVAGVAVVVIAFIGLWFWHGEGKPKEVRLEIWGVCTECGSRVKRFNEDLHIGEKCEKCGNEGVVYAQYRCIGKYEVPCGATFAFTPPAAAEAETEERPQGMG